MNKKIKALEDLKRVKDVGLRSIYPKRTKITVGTATCGMASGAGEVFEIIRREVEERELDAVVSKTGCIGFCQREPIVDVLEPGKPRIIYKEITSKKAVELVDGLENGEIKREWALCKMEEEEDLIEDETIKLAKGMEEVPSCKKLDFYEKQLKIASRNCGIIDPEKIEEYIARGGYLALYKVLNEFQPEEVIEEVKRSDLRGRGGAGFPAGIKWESTRDAEGEPKYVICNADEGDPGAYMDRTLLEGDPHTVLEGMIIGAYAIGSNDGYIYIRSEYPLAVEKIGIAIEQARAYGLLGKDIMGSGFNFDIKISKGGGAFVCGESSALMSSLEGKVGEPRAKYIHMSEAGLYGRPSDLNNVETWANVPVIISRGADWFARIGTEESKGTKIFSLVGGVNNTGLVEVPMGMTLREVVYDVGGGILNGRDFKAVQTGGPSGGVVPEKLLDSPVDFEELTKVGSMMGSGGMIVMDENTCVVDIAKYFIDFLKDESCGKCVPCREGLKRMLEILTDITEGKGKEGDIELLEELSEVLKDTSLCALGTTAPNPVLTTIRYFRDEYEAHLEGRCPAGVCKALIQYFIDTEKCTGCDRCVEFCPENAITGEKKKGYTYVINQDKCDKCGMCYDVCEPDAVVIK